MNHQHSLVFLPGWGMKGTIWGPLEERLKSTFAIYKVEWDGIDKAADFKRKALQFIEEKGLSSFVPVGWSLGALIALELAFSVPEKIERMVLISGTSRFIQGDRYHAGWNRRIVERMKRQLIRNREQTISTFINSLLYEDEKGKEIDFIDHFHCDKPNSLEAGLDYLMSADVRFAVRDISAPLLLIHGEKDAICPLSAAEDIVEQTSGKALLYKLPKTGHAPFLTKTDECAQLIQLFAGGEQ
ncbi:alpha/beta fold hydrolase [Bacillus smithii]|uniref:alpha/beta fold hydrolase n=1 Tax=Bacillus smithii TaxID=1479 RepID=UPI002E1AF489|nr:alpha/beta fold hydrolase [Bacillus smithii]MED1455960.1 alpha/beta fold hydrolase [Bacillus smithii]